MSHRISIFAILVLVATSKIYAQQAALFENVTVFDGEKIVGPTDVLVEKGKIAALGTVKELPEDLERVDGTGKTLMPGMIDCHNHAFFEAHLQVAAVFGVTTEMDMMSVPQLSRAIKQQQALGKATNRADMYSAGAAVTVNDGHGTQFGFPVPTLDKAVNAADFVTARKSEGSDFIKIIYEDGSAYGFSRPTLSEEMVKAAILAAHDLDLLAVAHVSTQDGARLVVKHGIDGLVHLFCDEKIDDALLKEMASRKVFVVPTACVVSNASGKNLTSMVTSDEHLTPFLDQEALNSLAQTFPRRAGLSSSLEILNHNILKLHQSGIPILAGTDAQNPGTSHGVSMHHESRLLQKAGLKPLEILRSCTSLPAQCFDLADRGWLRVGSRADMILVNGSPHKTISDLANIAGVWKGGHRIKRKSTSDRVDTMSPKSAGVDTEVSLISDFDGEKLESGFGAGWADSTDTIMGGSSTVNLELKKDGANKSKGALSISGKTRAQQPAFAGAMFSPGNAPMQPKDLSKYKQLTFWSKGDGSSFQVMLFFQKRGFTPSMKSFQADKKWTKHAFDISGFDGCEGTDIIGVWFGSGSAGEFDFQIDQVQLEE
ncbi:MAG: CIA30 family protein [Planctomycetota bacterium]